MQEIKFCNEDVTVNNYQAPFKDEQRKNIVNGIQCVFKDVVKTNKPHLISLEAPTGFGKTRIITEFYKKLASEQESTYWPQKILDSYSQDSKNIMNSRKVIFPSYSKLNLRKKGVLPEFMWLGIQCHSVNGTPIETLYESLSQLDTHKDYLEEAWSKHQTLFARINNKKSQKAGMKNTAEEGVNYILGEAVQAATNTMVPGLGLATKLVQWGMTETYDNIKKKKKIFTAGMVQEESRNTDLLDELTPIIAKLAIPQLPIIIVIEDFHSCHPVLKKFLERLLLSDSSILILTTSLQISDAESKRMDAVSFKSILQTRITRIISEQNIDDERFTSNTRFTELTNSSLSDLIKFYYSETEDSICKKLIRNYRNPLILEMICNSQKYNEKFKKNRKLEINDEEINRLPLDLKGIYLNVWNELTDVQKTYMALCSIAVPAGQLTWHNELINKTIKAMHNARGFIDSLSRQSVQLPNSWVTPVAQGDSLRKFNEYINFKITQDFKDERFYNNDIELYVTTLCKVLNSYELLKNSKENILLARLIVHFRQNHNLERKLVLKAIKVLQNEYRYRPNGIDYRLKLGRQLRDLNFGLLTESYAEALLEYAYDLKSSGRYDNALDTLTFMLQLLSSQKELDPELYFIVKNNLISIKGMQNKDGFAEQELQKQLLALMNEATLTLGASHHSVINICTNFYTNLDFTNASEDKIKEIETFLSHNQAALSFKNVLYLKHTIQFLKYKTDQISSDTFLNSLNGIFHEAYIEECYELFIDIGNYLGNEYAEQQKHVEALSFCKSVEVICAQLYGENSHQCINSKILKAELNINSYNVEEAIIDLHAAKTFLLSNTPTNSSFGDYDIYVDMLLKVIELYPSAGLHDELDELIKGIDENGLNIAAASLPTIINKANDIAHNRSLISILDEQNIHINSIRVLKRNVKKNKLDFIDFLIVLFKEKELKKAAFKLIATVEERNFKLNDIDGFCFRYLKANLHFSFGFLNESLEQLNPLFTERLEHYGNLEKHGLKLLINLAFNYWELDFKEKAITTILKTLSEDARCIDEELYYQNHLWLISWYQQSDLQDEAINLARKLLKDKKINKYKTIVLDAKELIGCCYIDKNEINRGIKILKSLIIELSDDKIKNNEKIKNIATLILHLEGNTSLGIPTRNTSKTKIKRNKAKKRFGKNKK